MTCPHFLLLLLTGLSGFQCQINTVRKASVEAGGSISIPCLYQQNYTEHVKYLCQGVFWLSCNIVIETQQRTASSGRFFISDDTVQRIFTVTINNLTAEDKHFWCAVRIENKRDARQYFQLSVTPGTQSFYVNRQEVSGYERGSVTVACYYKYPKVTQWCRLGSACLKDETGSIDGTPVIINTSIHGIFNVTLIDLSTESSGWYWCENGKFQMPVHITVHKLASETSMSTNTTTADNNQDEHKSLTKVTIVVTALLSQLLIVPFAFVLWRIIKRKKTEPEACEVTVGSQTFDADLLYAAIDDNSFDRTFTNNVTYSSVMKKEQRPTPESKE